MVDVQTGKYFNSCLCNSYSSVILESELPVVVQNKLHLPLWISLFSKEYCCFGKSGENSSIVQILHTKEWKTRQKTVGGVSRAENAGEPHC